MDRDTLFPSPILQQRHIAACAAPESIIRTDHDQLCPEGLAQTRFRKSSASRLA